jgi:Ca-activated chloride channel family protein
MNWQNFRGLGLLVALLSVTGLACGLLDSGGSTDGPPRGAVVVNGLANTALQPWLETAVSTFNTSSTKDANGDPIYVQMDYVEAGQAVGQLLADETAVLWLPDDPVWANILADQGSNRFQSNCVSTAQSPLVIAMWRDVAESLGWPGLPIGWLDVGSLAADPSAWNYYSGGGYGDTFRLGHTHPGLSGSGASTLLAIVQAAEAQTAAVTTDDIQKPIVQASVGAFEGGVTWFSSSTAALGTAMAERGVSYLGAGIMYESTVLQVGNGNIVPVYPLEGTFVSTHPACISQTADSASQAAATVFRDYLLSTEGQQTAVSAGFRPVNSSVALTTPFDDAHGSDTSQPTAIFGPPSVETVYAVQELWQAARKDINLVMLLDTSGSMEGDKIVGMRIAAEQFVQQMGDDDYISIIDFHTQPDVVVYHERVGDKRAEVIAVIQRMVDGGDTSLYDAIASGAQIIDQTTLPQTTNAMVVLTDGQDTNSRTPFNSDLIARASAHDTTIFTIAYGSDADEGTLQSLATQGNGNFFLGDEASITAIYDEMSAAFGGSVGVGR